MPNETQVPDHREQDAKRQKPQPAEQTTQGPEGFAQTSIDPSVAFAHASAAPPPAINPNDILSLQRAAGNQAVQRMLAQRKAARASSEQIVQANLTVNPPGDKYEQEADQMASQVMQRISSSQNGVAQRQEEEEEEPVQAKAVQRQEEEELQTKQTTAQTVPTVDSEAESRIDSAKGRGESLPDDIRGPMEQSFGADFSDVRVHTDSDSAGLNQSLQARAFTTGQDIFFGSGEYNPGTSAGKELVAHELTHVVQQNGAGIRRWKLKRESTVKSTPVMRKDEEETEQESAQEGELPDFTMEPGEEAEKGPDDRDKFDEISVSHSEAKVDSTTTKPFTGYRITVGKVGLDFSDSPVSVAGFSGDEGRDRIHNDTVKPGTVGVEWSNPGGKTVKAFGSESFKPGYKGMKYKKDGKGNIKLDFTLNIKCPWGVNSGGKTDIPSATDAVVTKDTYKKVVKDLTPKKIEKSWRAPRTKYWSKAICERHEKYHSTDDKKWSEGPGKKVVTDYLNGKTVSGWLTLFRLRSLLKKAMKEMFNANWDFYTGGAGSYLSYAGEERAFGDGKGPYENLAKGVKAQGEKLEKEAKKK